MLEVRGLTRLDLESFAGLVVQLYEDDPGPVAMDAARARAQAEAMLARSDHVWPLVLRMDGRVVGYAILVPYFSNEFGGDVVCLDELFVAREHRGRGVGGAFLDWLAAWAAGAGVPRLELFVNHDNVRALAFYRRHGFHVAARHVVARQLADPAPAAPARPRPRGP